MIDSGDVQRYISDSKTPEITKLIKNKVTNRFEDENEQKLL